MSLEGKQTVIYLKYLGITKVVYIQKKAFKRGHRVGSRKNNFISCFYGHMQPGWNATLSRWDGWWVLPVLHNQVSQFSSAIYVCNIYTYTATDVLPTVEFILGPWVRTCCPVMSELGETQLQCKIYFSAINRFDSRFSRGKTLPSEWFWWIQ